MLKIRSQQMMELEEAMMNDFFERMVCHVQSYFPEPDLNIDGRNTRERIIMATSQAFRYGMSAERELCFFITMDFVFGHDFTQNPELSWLTVALCSRPDSSASERILLAADLIEQKLRHVSSVYDDGDGADA